MNRIVMKFQQSVSYQLSLPLHVRLPFLQFPYRDSRPEKRPMWNLLSITISSSKGSLIFSLMTFRHKFASQLHNKSHKHKHKHKQVPQIYPLTFDFKNSKRACLSFTSVSTIPPPTWRPALRVSLASHQPAMPVSLLSSPQPSIYHTDEF
jgi:hypothetical protein